VAVSEDHEGDRDEQHEHARPTALLRLLASAAIVLYAAGCAVGFLAYDDAGTPCGRPFIGRAQVVMLLDDISGSTSSEAGQRDRCPGFHTRRATAAALVGVATAAAIAAGQTAHLWQTARRAARLLGVGALVIAAAAALLSLPDRSTGGWCGQFLGVQYGFEPDVCGGASASFRTSAVLAAGVLLLAVIRAASAGRIANIAASLAAVGIAVAAAATAVWIARFPRNDEAWPSGTPVVVALLALASIVTRSGRAPASSSGSRPSSRGTARSRT
jgi:hypothetical protein